MYAVNMSNISKIVTLFLAGLFFYSPAFVYAENDFSITEGSKNYSADITVERCEKDRCEGKGTIKLYEKNTKNLIQTFTSEDLYFRLDQDLKPSINVIQLYAEQSPLIFDDFDFDGFEDLAIRNGNRSSYGGPSYDVYVYNNLQKQFMLNGGLTALATKNLGMFRTDKARKRLITFAKSGCCWHLKTEYTVEHGHDPVKVYELEEDATNKNRETVKVTIRELVGNNWRIKVKKYKIKDYYKE